MCECLTTHMYIMQSIAVNEGFKVKPRYLPKYSPAWECQPEFRGKACSIAITRYLFCHFCSM